MGVPSLFRWFKTTFPGVVRKPAKRSDVDQCDNLYIDANSILHNATHPQDRVGPQTEDEMLEDIGQYLDHVIKVGKPTKLVYIAIDGVAPQAKIAQQRSRRFKASRDAVFEHEKKQEFLAQARQQGYVKYDAALLGSSWDSNTITPGTPFMANVDRWIHAWILRKFKADPAYAQLSIIFSGSSVPGEGEHKAMEFIRRQRAQEGYKPLRHCFYGPDADLIMLALATHEPDFRIVREDPQDQKSALCGICRETGHSARQCITVPHDHLKLPEREPFSPPDLIFFDVYLLRCALEPYLDHTKDSEGKPIPPLHADDPGFNFERALDDFIVLVTLLGNDFLPALPLPDFEIYLGAISTVVDIWKVVRRHTRSYLTKDGEIRVARLRELFKGLSDLEAWSDKEELPRMRGDLPKAERYSEAPDYKRVKKASETPIPFRATSAASQVAKSKAFVHPKKPQLGTPDSKFLEGMPPLSDSLLGSGIKRGADELDYGYDFEEKEAVRNAFPTKDSYYEEKFGERGKNPSFRQGLMQKYTEGLCWVFAYYHQGCPSWDWVYDEHFGPYPSDSSGLGYLEIHWKDRGTPVSPFYQLMMVFPPGSADFVPEPLRHFMTDPKSPVSWMYPRDFKVDPNGKKQEWKGIALLPFVDYKQLERYVQPVLNDSIKWRDSEVVGRNKQDNAKVFVSMTHPLFGSIKPFEADPRLSRRVNELDPALTFGLGLRGQVWRDPTFGAAVQYNQQTGAIMAGEQAQGASANYAPPSIAPGREHKSVVLDGQPLPRKYIRFARLKLPSNYRGTKRGWSTNENAGRRAADVAEEARIFKQTGKKPKSSLLSGFEALFLHDEQPDEAFIPLDEWHDDVILPIFPEEKDMGMEGGWGDDLDDEGLPDPENADKLPEQAAGITDQPMYGEEVTVKVESSDSEDPDDPRSKKNKKRAKVGKAKEAKEAKEAEPLFREPSVKREEGDSAF